jgi:release factor glutamine methyltransferase
MTTTRAALSDAALRLNAAGVEDPTREARLLLAHALRVAPHALPAADDRIDTESFDMLLARRVRREPMALILGHCGFWTLDLYVSPSTLIPRPDSETLIQAAIEAFPERGIVHRVLDLGTGTGCLLLAALTEFPEAFGIGTDLSAAAAGLAARNAAATGLSHRAAFLAADWDAPLSGRMDLILCNPPYISSDDIQHLMPEVKRYEPLRALDGGWDGLHAYGQVIPLLADRLARGGVAILELGHGQEQAVSALAEAAGFLHIVAKPDLAGVPRALVLADPLKKQFGSGRRGG